jgi:hypothetical protein
LNSPGAGKASYPEQGRESARFSIPVSGAPRKVGLWTKVDSMIGLKPVLSTEGKIWVRRRARKNRTLSHSPHLSSNDAQKLVALLRMSEPFQTYSE